MQQISAESRFADGLASYSKAVRGLAIALTLSVIPIFWAITIYVVPMAMLMAAGGLRKCRGSELSGVAKPVHQLFIVTALIVACGIVVVASVLLGIRFEQPIWALIGAIATGLGMLFGALHPLFAAKFVEAAGEALERPAAVQKSGMIRLSAVVCLVGFLALIGVGYSSWFNDLALFAKFMSYILVLMLAATSYVLLSAALKILIQPEKAA